MQLSFRSPATILLCAFAATAWGAGPEQVLINAKNMNWGAAPTGFPAGAKVAVLYGDPATPGPYVLRMRLPARYKLPFHWHTHGQTMTVISGVLYVANTETYNKKIAHAAKQGGFISMPARAQQFAFTKGAAEVEIRGDGPFDIQYNNPSEDPTYGATGKPYYFPKEYESNEMSMPQAGEPIPTF